MGQGEEDALIAGVCLLLSLAVKKGARETTGCRESMLHNSISLTLKAFKTNMLTDWKITENKKQIKAGLLQSGSAKLEVERNRQTWDWLSEFLNKTFGAFPFVCVKMNI